jgi:hypothetical protein
MLKEVPSENKDKDYLRVIRLRLRIFFETPFYLQALYIHSLVPFRSY